MAWEACLKNAEVKLELLTNNDMLVIVEKGIRGGICHATHKYAKADNRYMENYNKDIESSYLMYLDASNLYGWAMSQKFPVNGFKCRLKALLKIKLLRKYFYWMFNNPYQTQHVSFVIR